VEIVDTQVHMWGANRPEYPWPENYRGSEPHRPYPFGGDQLIPEMDEAGVQRAVVLPVTWAGNHNQPCLEAARKYPSRIGVMGFLSLQAPESRGRLKTWLDQPGMLGLRVNVAYNVNREAFSEGRLEWMFAEAEEAGVPVYILARQTDSPLLAGVAERHPQLRLALDHLGITGGIGQGEKAFRDLDQVLKLSARPSIAVKISSLPLFADDPYPYRALHSQVRRVYDAFGPRRMFWGTNMTRLPCTYRQAVTMFTEEMPWLGGADLDWIMGRGLREWIGWS
jgi:L-fuconolactonase